MNSRPVIGIPADRRIIGPHPFHAVGEKYIAAVVQAADCLPLLIPVLESPLDVTEILARVDGIFFPGSPQNRLMAQVNTVKVADTHDAAFSHLI